MPEPRPSLSLFEDHVAAGPCEPAVGEAVRILYAIDGALGALAGVEGGGGDFPRRFAAAFGALMIRADLVLDGWSAEALFIQHRWIDLAFALGDPDARAGLRARLTRDEGARRGVGGAALAPYLLLSSPAEGLPVDLDALFAANPALTLVAALGWLGNRYCVTAPAGEARERLLAWLPGKLDRLSFGGLRLAHLPDVYMTCSYASGADKHRIKADLIAGARAALLAAGCPEMTKLPRPGSKPRVVVVVEALRPGHSVYRTHIRAIRSLKGRFEVIGVGPASELADPQVAAAFDTVIPYGGDDFVGRVRGTAEVILGHAPRIVFHVGVGLRAESIALAALRLAPVQCASFGHAATTMSPAIDWMVVPDDFVGSDAAFSERLLRLAPEAMPYARPAPGEPPAPARQPLDPAAKAVRIAVPASALKLNAGFLDALARIAARATRPVEFVFFPLGSVGLAHAYLRQEIGRALPGATVHAQLPRQDYLRQLGRCAFFLCPFPYGNMNSIIDAVVMGLPGVCLDGEELHAHADIALFRRLGLPGSLAASSLDGYVDAALRLIDDRSWLNACRGMVEAIDLERRAYGGDERLFCEAMADLAVRTSV